jgi:hypothetical protein
MVCPVMNAMFTLLPPMVCPVTNAMFTILPKECKRQVMERATNKIWYLMRGENSCKEQVIG